MDKELLNVLKLVDMYVNQKNNNDNRYFNIISVWGGGIFIERYANLCVGSKCCLTIFIVYKINIPKPLYNL